MKKSNVLICGDLVWDTYIARLPIVNHGYSAGHSKTQLKNNWGGAWYLQEVIEFSIKAYNQRIKSNQSDLDGPTEHEMQCQLFFPKMLERDILEGESCPAGIAKGFSVWKWYPGVKSLASAVLRKNGNEGEEIIDLKWPKGKAQPGTWRVSEFLGCQAANWTSGKGVDIFPKEPDQVDVLVIENLGLGFAYHQQFWPSCLVDKKKYPSSIVVKGGFPFTSPLMKHLLDNHSLSERVTIILGADGWRENGANISRGISWDRTIADLVQEFSPTGAGRLLRHCKRVVVFCGRSGAGVFSRIPRSPAEYKKISSTIQFERFVFDPDYVEDKWSSKYDGHTFGTSSVMTAAFVTHELSDKKPSSYITVGRGLQAARELHLHNGGHDADEFNSSTAEERAFSQDTTCEPWKIFQSAYPRELLDEPIFTRLVINPSILTDIVGCGADFLNVVAEYIVKFGHERVLQAVPKLKCGKYFTVDREEIENLNTVRQLIEDYRIGEDHRPLSIAVFGAPGSGKSFAIKQLAEEIFGEQHASLEFNLSQFKSIDDLHEALQEVRDKSIQKQIPLVFWDEFDGVLPDENSWYKEFLAPMQDASFQARGKAHPIGKCIFIFAGGRYSTFEKFDQSDAKDEKFQKQKGPDFVSRLRGYVNIKGPNPIVNDHDESIDEVSVVRRGILLRSLIERYHPQIIHPETRILGIHPNVLAAFLRVKKYKHGSRSMEAIVSLSHLHGWSNLGPSELPPFEIIKFHVTEDFSSYYTSSGNGIKAVDQVLKSKYYMSTEDVETLAALKHELWKKEKMSKGYVLGAKRDDYATPKTHHLLKPFPELEEADKDINRMPARLAMLRLEMCGYHVIPKELDFGKKGVTKLQDEELKKLARSEHRRWMREKLIKGYAFAEKSADDLLLHEDICKSEFLKEGEPYLDEQIIEAIFEFLKERGLVMVKKEMGI